jgi:hypothetical protein
VRTAEPLTKSLPQALTHLYIRFRNFSCYASQTLPDAISDLHPPYTAATILTSDEIRDAKAFRDVCPRNLCARPDVTETGLIRRTEPKGQKASKNLHGV